MFGAGVCPVFGQLDPTDPWPKYAHDERNTCYVAPPYAGPHVKPVWKWWARIDYDTGYPYYHLRGPAIAYFTGWTATEPLILIGTRTGSVLVFKAYYGPGELDPDDGAAPIGGFPVNGAVNSTPLILPNDRVVVQTESELQVWDFSNPLTPSFRWRAPGVNSAGSSPTFGPQAPGSLPNFIFAQAFTTLYCFEPTQPNQELDPDVDSVWRLVLAPSDEGRCSPALGPSGSGQENLVYAARAYPAAQPGEMFFFSALATTGQLNWQAGLYPWYGMKIGTYAPPCVHHATAPIVANQVLFPADDGGVYAEANVVGMPPARRWTNFFGHNPPDPDYISAAAALTPNGQALFWTERGYLWHIADLGDHYERLGGPAGPDGLPNIVMGAGVLDAYRLYLPQGANCLVGGVAYPFTGEGWDWGTREDLPPGVPVQPFHSPLAILPNGWLVCASHGYLFVLGPPDGDLNGDGVGDNYDIDALALALDDPKAWQTRYGAVYGINLLGVGDANRDWRFNGKDIDPLAVKMIANFRGGQAEWDYFWRTIDALKVRHP